MSPRIALTTACSDSPSKLNVACPVLPPRLGGGALAASRLMVWPVPRRMTGRGSTSGDSSGWRLTPSWSADDVPGGGATPRAASRRMVGAGLLAHAASRVASNATSIGRIWERLIVATLVGVGRRRRLLRLAPELFAPGLDAFAD